ncbi:Protein CBG10375 [Caenorhabditis briggsae]|uniref:Protein CBG10375 n=1 Tax=Caenorhabditis briggsae TaxID=6238 RepID=A8XB24_CAEBR|nr:Protein CBG10375 [Caenorhabditis briggsae]CAP29804.2 Protein CBG10375 [Caenorhabditis briggsae]
MNSTRISHAGYFDSPEFLSLVLHINTIISTPIHLFGFYCIIWKTPIAMKSAKLYLLNLHIWVVLFDYSLSTLTIPFLLLPHFAVYTLGVFSWFHVPYWFQITMIFFFFANMVVSIVTIFESRFYTVCQFAWKPYWKRWRKVGITIYHVVYSCLVIPFVFLAPDQETAIRSVFAKLPRLPQYIYEANIYVLCEDYTYHLFSLVAILISAFVMVFSFSILLMWNAVVQLKSRTMSQKTFQLQKSFLISLGIQILIPVCTFALPGIYLWISILVDYYDQSLNHFTVCLFSIHGFLSSMVMTLVHRPYREALFSFFSKKASTRSNENSTRRFARFNHAVSVGVIAT